MTENTNKRRPSHTIYTVQGDGPGANWVQIGLAFPHKDGQGLGLVFNEAPGEGRLTLRAIPAAEPKAAPKEQGRLPLPAPIKLPDPKRRMA
jgi:hypothetical protein